MVCALTYPVVCGALNLEASLLVSNIGAEAQCSVTALAGGAQEALGGPPSVLRVNCTGTLFPVPVVLGQNYDGIEDLELKSVDVVTDPDTLAAVPPGEWTVTFLAHNLTRLTLVNSRVQGISMAPPGSSGPLLRVMGGAEVVVRDSVFSDVQGLAGPVLQLDPPLSTAGGDSSDGDVASGITVVLTMQHVTCTNVIRVPHASNPDYYANCGSCIAVHASFRLGDGSRLHDCSFSGNSAQCGGALALSSLVPGAVMMVVDSVFDRNQASETGGALTVIDLPQNSTLSLVNTSVGNNAAGITGGAVSLLSGLGGTLALTTGSIMDGNAAGNVGGAVFIADNVSGWVLLHDGSSLSRNTAPAWGALAIKGDFAGAIEVFGGSRLDGNTATESYGGAIGLLGAWTGSLTIANRSSSSGNSAVEEGGVADVGGSMSGAWVVRDGSNVTGNSAAQGGVLSVVDDFSGTFQVSGGSRVDRNRAVAGHGGVLFNWSNCTTTASLIVSGTSSMSGNSASGFGGVLHVEGDLEGRLEVLDGSVMDDNAGRTAAGVVQIMGAMKGALRVVHRSSMSRNTAGSSGSGRPGPGGVLACLRGLAGEIVVAHGSRMDGNRGTYGGIAYINDTLSGTLMVTDGSSVSDNYAELWGGGFAALLDITGRVVVSNNSTIARNRAARGGFLYIRAGLFGEFVVANGSRLVNNTADVSGGVVFSQDRLNGHLKLENNSWLEGNSAAQDGGALYFGIPIGYFRISGSGTLQIANNSGLVGNRAGRDGGGLYYGVTMIGTITLGDGAVLRGNSAGRYGGGMCFNSIMTNLTELASGSIMEGCTAGSHGGGIYVYRIAGTLALHGSKVLNNTSDGGDGGALHAVHVNGAVVVSGGSTLSGNAASSGGALHVGEVAAGAIVSISDGVGMSGNTAGLEGGLMKVVRCAGTVQVVSGCSAISNNATLRGGAVSLAELQGSLQISSSLFANNSVAVQSGGAVHVSFLAPGALVNLTGSHFGPGNQAQLSGGALYLAASQQPPLQGTRRTAQRTRFSSSANAAAVIAEAAAEVHADQCSFAGNSALSAGGGAVAVAAAGAAVGSVGAEGLPTTGGTTASAPGMLVKVASSNFTANTATQGGALQLTGSAASLSLTSSGFYMNTAGGSGGALSLQQVSGPVRLQGNVLADNVALDDGGALHASQLAYLTVEAADVARNMAGGAGGGVFFDRCTSALLTRCNLTQNHAYVRGGGVVLDAGNAASLVPSSSTYQAVLEGLSFQGNSAGGVTASSAGVGGGVHVSGAVSALLDSVTFNGDAATVGPAVATEQRCSMPNGSASTTTPATRSPFAPDDDDSQQWPLAVAALTNASTTSSCWPVVMSDITVYAGSSSSAHGLVALPQQPSAVLLACSADGTASPSEVASTGTDAPAGSVRLPLPANQSAADEVLAQYVAQSVAQDAADASGGAVPLARMRNTLSTTCGGTVQGGGSAMDLSPEAILAVNPRSMELVSTAWAGWQLRANAAGSMLGSAPISNNSPSRNAQGMPWSLSLPLNATVNITAEMRTFMGTLMQDHVPINVSLSMDSNSSSSSSTPARLLGELVTEARNGFATWAGITVRALQGLYTLRVTAADEAAQAYVREQKVSLVPALVRVLPCSMGQVPCEGGTTCQVCEANTFSLWQDPAWDELLSSGLDNGQGLLTAPRSGVACDTCGPHAICPGGRVIAPLPGWWHSAPNSTEMHRCPNAKACTWEDRTSALVACQQAWYDNVTTAMIFGQPARSLPAVCNTSPSLAPSGAGRRALHAEQPTISLAVPYGQLQCAEGYTGPLCAACQPGYYSNSEYECKRCLGSVVQTAWLGIAFFASGVALLAGSLYATFRDDYTCPAELGVSDMLKVLIVHVQYLIIIVRLNIPWPSSVQRFSTFFSAFTGTESYLAFSPSCLVPAGDSAWQARAQLLGSLLIPVAVTLACMVLWTARWFWQSWVAQRRSFAFAFAQPSSPPGDAPLFPLPSATTLVNMSYQLSQPTNSSVAHSHALPQTHSKPVPAVVAQAPGQWQGQCPQHVPENTNANTVALSLDTDMAASSLKPGASTDGDAQATAAAGVPGRVAEAAGSSPVDAALVSPFLAAAQAAASVPRQSPPSLPLPQPQPGQYFAGAVAPDANSNPAGLQSMPMPPALRLGGLTPLSMPGQAQAAGFTSPTAGFSPAVVAKASDAQPQPSGGLSIKPQSSSATALMFMDTALPLWRQLLLVLLVAAFILYPGWANAALSVFACYKVDSGEGKYSENQRATWRYGYWIRDMMQECYVGLHARLYLPIGIVAVVVFCVGPPLTSLLLLWTHRHRLHEPDVAQQYGFLYRRYRPEWWFFECILQLETFALVAVSVFGRTLPAYRQVLVLLAVLLAISIFNMTCGAWRHPVLRTMECTSLNVLLMTVGLSLFFLESSKEQREEAEQVSTDAVGITIIFLNTALLILFAGMMIHHRRAVIRAGSRRILSGVRGLALSVRR